MASLRIWSEMLSFRGLRKWLGEPTEGYSRGDPNVGRVTGRSYKPRAASLWQLESDVDRFERLDRHVIALLDTYESRLDALADVAGQYEVDLFCSVFNNDDINCSFVFEPELSGRLARLNVPVLFNCW